MANWLNQLQSLLGQQGRSSSSDDQSSGKNLLLPGALGGLYRAAGRQQIIAQAVSQIRHRRAAGRRRRGCGQRFME